MKAVVYSNIFPVLVICHYKKIGKQKERIKLVSHWANGPTQFNERVRDPSQGSK